MAKYQFLTPEWVAAAKAIREEFEGESPAPAHSVRMNQIITEVPFGDTDVKAFMDTSDGALNLDLGELENPDLTVTVDYETAKAISNLVEECKGDARAIELLKKVESRIRELHASAESRAA